MAQETNQTPLPTLCPTGCGFYGNPRTNGMCSVCHKEYLSRQGNEGVGAVNGIGIDNNLTAESSDIQMLEAAIGSPAAPTELVAEAEVAVPEAVSGKSTSNCVVQEMTDISLDLEEAGTSEMVPSVFPVVSQPTVSDPFHTAGNGQNKPVGPSKPRKNRCHICRKKVGLTGFNCRCGNLFCGIHRYSDKHNCSYDYKAEGAAKIRRENPVVIAEKIRRI